MAQGLTVSTAPRVSVIVPLYNRAHLIARALRSVESQTYRNWELIVVDDGSTDGSGDVVHAEFPSAVLIRQENRGVGAARNTGIAAAQGECISMLDSDDEYLPEHLESRVAALYDGAQPADLLAGGIEVVGLTTHVVDYYDPTKLVDLADCVTGGSLFGRTEIFRALGGFNDARYGEDTDFWIRAAGAQYRTRFLNSPRTYRLHETPGSLRDLRMSEWKQDRPQS
jgi:glycosyltransferase involved in cell wall biosynthesis